VAVLTEDVFLGVGTVFPLKIGRLDGEVRIMMINLVARGAQIGLEVEPRLDALVKVAAAAFFGLVRTTLEKL
jgi:hypothetical protein